MPPCSRRPRCPPPGLCGRGLALTSCWGPGWQLPFGAKPPLSSWARTRDPSLGLQLLLWLLPASQAHPAPVCPAGRKLEALDLSYNRLVHVPSFLPRGLRRLTLHHNRIERIPGYVFAHMKPGLEFLHLSHNSLRADGIHGASFLGLQASLAELLLDHNQLQAVPRGLLGLRALQVLRLSHNKIR